jgi:hypothetical protein
MSGRVIRWLAVAAATCWAAGPAAGRLVESWSYDRLFKEADLVVIAVPAGEEKADDAFGERPWHLDVVGLNTTFDIKHTLKGEAEGEQVKMLHFRFADPPKGKRVVIDDGPEFVAVRRKSLTVREGDRPLHLWAPEYLLFLRRLKDGRYEPVSGKVDPKFAVRELSEPLDDTFGERRKREAAEPAPAPDRAGGK